MELTGDLLRVIMDVRKLWNSSFDFKNEGYIVGFLVFWQSNSESVGCLTELHIAGTEH